MYAGLTTELMPELLRDMWRKRCQKLQKSISRLAQEPRVHLFVLEAIECIHEFHDAADRRIEHEAIAHIFRDLLYRLMQHASEGLLIRCQRLDIIARLAAFYAILEVHQYAPYAV